MFDPCDAVARWKLGEIAVDVTPPLTHEYYGEHVGLDLDQYGLQEVVPQDAEVFGCSSKRFRPIECTLKEKRKRSSMLENTLEVFFLENTFFIFLAQKRGDVV